LPNRVRELAPDIKDNPGVETKMKIMLLTYASGTEGLANIDIFTPMKELIQKGHDFYLVARKDTEPYQIGNEHGSIYVIPRLPQPSYTFFLSTPFLLLRIFRLVRHIRPDIILIDNDLNLPVIGFLLSLANRLPRVIIFREATLENLCNYLSSNWLVKLGAWISLKINYYIFNKTRHLVAIAPMTFNFFRKTLKRDDIRSINFMCIRMDEFTPSQVTREEWRQRFKLGDNEIILMYNGAIEHDRRLDLLINAIHHLIKEYPYIKLMISGKGSEKTALAQQVEELGLANSVIFVDWLPREDVRKFVSLADICVEPFPRKDMTPSGKLLEWMASGKCVITTRNTSHESWIRHKHNGLLFEPDNEESLISSIKMLLQQKNLMKSLGENARMNILIDYDVKNVAPIIEEFCNQVVSEHNLEKVQERGGLCSG
jgi:glycosyltransferase involved in cell wall biosynthesis